MTRMSWLSSLGSMPRPAHTAIAASRLNGACGEQQMLEASGALAFSRSTSASPAASASAASWPADPGAGLPEPETNASASSSGAAPACHWSGCVVAARPGISAASCDNIHAPWARPVARTPAPAPADQARLPSPARALPSSRQPSGWPAGTGTASGDSSSKAACPPQARPPTTADTADRGSLPDMMASRAGGANAAQANLEGGRTDPTSTATTRIPMACIKRPAAYARNTSADSGRTCAQRQSRRFLIPGGARRLPSESCPPAGPKRLGPGG